MISGSRDTSYTPTVTLPTNAASRLIKEVLRYLPTD